MDTTQQKNINADSYSKWTAEDDLELMYLLETEKKGISEIADDLKRTLGAIKHRIERLQQPGIGSKFYSDFDFLKVKLYQRNDDIKPLLVIYFDVDISFIKHTENGDYKVNDCEIDLIIKHVPTFNHSNLHELRETKNRQMLESALRKNKISYAFVEWVENGCLKVENASERKFIGFHFLSIAKIAKKYATYKGSRSNFSRLRKPNISSLPNNHGKKWCGDQEDNLFSLFEKKLPIAEIANELERTEISILMKLFSCFPKRRSIKYLVHFTRLENLELIKEYGILSREKLEEKSLEYIANDLIRYDDKLDRISLSISNKNTFLFDAFRKRNPNVKWVELFIDPLLLTISDALFFDSNAASAKFKNVSEEDLSSADALLGIFADEVITSRKTLLRKSHPSSNPTSVQAEILVKDIIPKECILNYREIND
jgi:DNA-binding Lrp family transcriptional regulator